MILFLITLITGLATGLSACSPFSELACNDKELIAIQDILYFGTAKPKGTVTPEEWTGFLNATVTPLFPRGHSVWRASGQWRSGNGVIQRESSYVLNLIHPENDISDKAVLEIMATYKLKFQQEAVLRVKSKACVTY